MSNRHSPKNIRLSKVAKELGVSPNEIIEFLENRKEISGKLNRNSKIPLDIVPLLEERFSAKKKLKEDVKQSEIGAYRDMNKKQEEENKDPQIQEPETKSNEESKEVEHKPVEEPEPTTEETKEDNEIVATEATVQDLSEQVENTISEEIPEQEIATDESTENKPPDIPEPQDNIETKKTEDNRKIGLKILGKNEDLIKGSKNKSKLPRVKEKPVKRKKTKVSDKSPSKSANVKIVSSHKRERIEKTKEVLQKSSTKVNRRILDIPKKVEKIGRIQKLEGLTIVDKDISLLEIKKTVEKEPIPKTKSIPEASPSKEANTHRKRKRVKKLRKSRVDFRDESLRRPQNIPKERRLARLQSDADDSYKQTMAQLKGSKISSKLDSKRTFRKEKRSAIQKQKVLEQQENLKRKNILKVSEFTTTRELASLMEIETTEVIAKCMTMDVFVTINQKLEKDIIEIIAPEFGYTVEFESIIEKDLNFQLEEEDNAEFMEKRSPIITIMGHVDHGKTSLLDYIRNSKIVDKEAGGITQHIGAYEVEIQEGKKIVFLDTPGHEAFTSMRARGTKVTDIAIIVIAADDKVGQQTIEAIKHAQIAEVSIVIAINKVDLEAANPDEIKRQLAEMDLLVSDWGGSYSCYHISAKTGEGIDDMLEGLVIESDEMDLNADTQKRGIGTIIESSLDKGRGYYANVLLQKGVMKVGNFILAGYFKGKVKAIFNQLGKKIQSAGPASAIQILGLNGAPEGGEKIYVMESEQQTKEIAIKKEQIYREQNFRAKRRITLTDISKHIAQGGFNQLNIILKCDVEGSVGALSDALLKVSTPKVQVNILYKAVGAINKSDIMLAKATDSVIVGFQVRPSTTAKTLAEKEAIEIRIYSIIYEAIEDLQNTIKGLEVPEVRRVFTGSAVVKEVFKISNIGTIAGCYVTEGTIKRDGLIKVVRDGIVIYGLEKGGVLQSLKRFKDDVKEVKQGYECGLSIKSFKDIQVEDVIEFSQETT